jgi:hypothetical protein
LRPIVSACRFVTLYDSRQDAEGQVHKWQGGSLNCILAPAYPIVN